MENPHDNPAALKALQDAIYREKILRAREMSAEERFNEALELTNSVSERMIEGVIWQTGIMDREQAIIEVRKSMDRMARARDKDFYVSVA